MNKDCDSILIIDTSAFIFRAFYSVPMMKSSDDMPINAVFGFFSMIFNIIKNTNAKCIVFAMDSKEKTFWDDLYDYYKSNRVKCPEELAVQFKILDEGLRSSGLKYFQVNGLEADDIIATFSLKHFIGLKKIICSKDKDLMQLIKDDEVEMYDSKTNSMIRQQNVIDKFGIESRYISDYLALVGDSSDNIPGAKNIGPKKACDLIKKYGSIEAIYNTIETKSHNNKDYQIEDKITDLLLQSKDSVLLSKQLTSFYIHNFNQNDFININDFNISKIDNIGLESFFIKYKIPSLIGKLKSINKTSTDAKSIHQTQNPHIPQNTKDNITFNHNKKPSILALQDELF